MHNIIVQSRMTMVSTVTTMAAEPMCAQTVHPSSTVMTGMGFRPTATLMVLSSILRPSEEIGSTSSQAPVSLTLEASKQLRALGSGASVRSPSAVFDAFMASHDFCLHLSAPSGGALLRPIDHWASAASTLRRGQPWRAGGTIF